MNEKEFSRRLYQLRDNKKISARYMSQDLGLNSGYISSIENGKSMPKMGNFFRICDYLGVTPVEFFDISRPNPGKSHIFIERISGLTDDELDHLMLVVDDILRNK